MAYLDRSGDADAVALRGRAGRGAPSAPVTFGWAPRFLHSTGQYHKGGPQTGVFLQLTGAVADDLQVPGRPFTLRPRCRRRRPPATGGRSPTGTGRSCACT